MDWYDDFMKWCERRMRWIESWFKGPWINVELDSYEQNKVILEAVQRR